jgi:nucleotide-binding universal stress UspA family protein
MMYKRIVLAYDGSDSGQNALLDCRDLAQWSHAELALVAVMPTGIGLVAMEGGMFDTDMMVCSACKAQETRPAARC